MCESIGKNQKPARPILAGARRGLKFGALVGVAIWLQMVCVALMLTPGAWADLNFGAPLELLGTIAESMVSLLLIVVYSALTGAAVMGLGAIFAARSDNSATSGERSEA